MKPKLLTLLVLALLASPAAHGICTPAGEPRGPILLRGSIKECRSALPAIEAALNARRERHEAWAEPLRQVLSDRLTRLRPYDELVADHLSRVAGVIVTFAVESQMELPPDLQTRDRDLLLVWPGLDAPHEHQFFLRLDGNSCDDLPQPSPTVVTANFDCCDVDPPSSDSCIVGLPAVVAVSPERLLD